MTALVALTVVHVCHTIVALAAYEHRIGVVTHDGSGTVDMLDTVIPLDTLSVTTFCLVLLTLLATLAAVGNWIVQTWRAGRKVAPTAPVAWWGMSAVAAALLNSISAAWYLSATANGAAYMRSVLAETTLLLLAASASVVITTITGTRVVRRTAPHAPRPADAEVTAA